VIITIYLTAYWNIVYSISFCSLRSTFLLLSCRFLFLTFCPVLSFLLFFSLSEKHTKRPYCPSSSSSSSSKKKGVNNLKDKDKDKDKDKEKDEIPTDEAGNTPCFLFMDSSSYHAAKRITDNLRL
jgi:hypothetical protein